MSHSTRKTPITGITKSDSEKADKRRANRALRRTTKKKLSPESDDAALPTIKEVSDTWNMAKDGKVRFEPSRHPRLMRK